jgi:hypothetical protein
MVTETTGDTPVRRGNHGTSQEFLVRRASSLA